MLISNVLGRHKTPAPRFAPGLFLGLIVVFAFFGNTKPVVALVGLGVTLLITGALIELNRALIWDNYRKNYKKTRSAFGIWGKPNPVYYTINVVFLWPFIMFLGLVCLWAAYVLY